MKNFIDNPGIIWERMIQVLNELGFDCTPSSMAEIIGVSEDDFLFLNDFNEMPSPKTIVKFLKAFPEVNEEWLFGGTGLIFNPIVNDYELLSHNNEKLTDIVEHQKLLIEEQNLVIADQNKLIDKLNDFCKIQPTIKTPTIDDKNQNSDSLWTFFAN